MPVPWEALIPFGLVTAMFGAAGTLFNVSKRAQNQGKASFFFSTPYPFRLPRVTSQPPRYHIDSWEEMLMDRDQRLTGHARKQTSNPVAPEGFGTSSVWYTERAR
ncbi:small secreted protein [Russula earlei]|uniref:Small secreted protein n=1 Tax=Russula earlei TaxID=71964 RepID=A0ACC0UQ80_9AGAM|nr:small secreted protein [Russula earlei]